MRIEIKANDFYMEDHAPNCGGEFEVEILGVTQGGCDCGKIGYETKKENYE